MTTDKRLELLELAEGARAAAYCPYSGVSVGAALLTSSGRVYLGSNIESAAFSPSVCAERVALLKAVSEGERDFVAIAVAGGRSRESTELFYPCGVCRQALSEFCGGGLEILLRDGEGVCSLRLDELLPHPFDKKLL